MAICLFTALGINNTTSNAVKTVKVTAVKITNLDYSNYVALRKKGTLILTTSISPKNASNKSITWTSSDKTIALVNKQGVVTGVNRGICKITGVTKDGSNKKVTFYVKVYSDQEFFCDGTWKYNNGKNTIGLSLSSSGEYTMYDIGSGNEKESGLYTLDTSKQTLTLTRTDMNSNTQKVWDYTIKSRNTLLLSDGTTHITYTRNKSNKHVICTSKGLLYQPNGTTQADVLGYIGIDTTVTIPSTINKLEVTWVSGFSGNTDIEQVILPDSVTYVDGFKGCTNLKSIIMPDHVNYLSASAFENCTSLESVQLPTDLSSILEKTFKGCTSLKSVEIPDQVASIDSEAFGNCTSLQTLYFPKGIKEIEADILKGCNKVVIYGYKDTRAEEFAAENNLTYVER